MFKCFLVGKRKNRETGGVPNGYKYTISGRRESTFRFD